MRDALALAIVFTDAAAASRAITTARRAAEKTQKQLADEMGVDVSTLRRWEDGKSEPPTGRLITVFKKCGFTIAAFADKNGAVA